MSDTARRPILLSVPHSADRVPDEVRDIVALDEHDLKHYTDLYTDRIFDVEHVYRVVAPYSRVIVDVNRAPDDISKEYELAAEGVIVHTTWDGRPVYRREPSQELADILIEKYHDPYHREIDDAMSEVRFLIDCHSYLPVGPKLKKDSGIKRPDINLGNMNFSSCTRAHTVFFRDFFVERGYTVDINFPYAGKYILGHHCHRRRIPSFLVPGIQIEINQGLYVHENGIDPLPGRVEEFQALFRRLVDVFSQTFLGHE